MELIDKSKLLEGLKKIKQNLSASPIVVIEDVESLVESLEVKDVDLEEELNDFIEQQRAWIKDDRVVEYNNGDSFNHIYDLEETAKHFFELGLATQSSSVWHYVSAEKPTKFGESIIIASKNKDKEDGIWLYDLIQSWEGEWSPRVNWETPVKWAYMDDLFKAKKG